MREMTEKPAPAAARVLVVKLSSLGDVAAIIEAGGVFEYARNSGMLK